MFKNRKEARKLLAHKFIEYQLAVLLLTKVTKFLLHPH